MARVMQMRCSCCGGDAGRFEQWWNRDTGYGLCGKCAEWIDQYRPFGREIPEERIGGEEFTRCYGYEGKHWSRETGRGA